MIETNADLNLPPVADGGAAVITGGASGIGFAAARRFASLGLRVAIADLPGERLQAAETSIKDAGGRILAVAADVAVASDVALLRDIVLGEFGRVGVLMLNAGIGLNPGGTWKNLEGWRTLMDVNLWGVIHGAHAFLPAMVEARRPGFVIVTGSKQGITTPPGNAAYNVSKAGLKAFAEALQHELRSTENCPISAHLLIPGFTFTGINARPGGKPNAAWAPEEVIEFMLASLARGDFYILCPDNDVPRALDEKRMQWAAGDIVENRPPLSRWHPDYGDAFKRFVEGK